VNYAGGQNTDCHGHGTHVAGTVGGATYGVAKQVRLVAVKVLNCAGSGSTIGVVSGINWVRQNAVKPAVANMSLGGGISTSIDNAVTNAVNSGIVFAVAAGNSNANACNYSPARAAAAITVGATTSTDARASYSNYGSCVDIFAPGSNITSAWRTSNSATNTISGTSMATPHVAGVAALFLSGNTGASPSTVASALIANATLSKITGLPAGTANRLLFTNY
jgi:subtilisin family serine protease